MRKYELGDKWSADFDYDGMLEMGMETSVDWSIEDLKKLSISFTDVNYHELNENLYTAILELINGNKELAKEFLDEFHKDIIQFKTDQYDEDVQTILSIAYDDIKELCMRNGLVLDEGYYISDDGIQKIHPSIMTLKDDKNNVLEIVLGYYDYDEKTIAYIRIDVKEKEAYLDSDYWEVEDAENISMLYKKGGDIKDRGIRPSPKESATIFKAGTRKRGQDGNMWEVTVAKNGVKRWKKIGESKKEPRDRKPVPKKSPEKSETKPELELLKGDRLVLLLDGYKIDWDIMEESHSPSILYSFSKGDEIVVEDVFSYSFYGKDGIAVRIMPNDKKKYNWSDENNYIQLKLEVLDDLVKNKKIAKTNPKTKNSKYKIGDIFVVTRKKSNEFLIVDVYLRNGEIRYEIQSQSSGEKITYYYADEDIDDLIKNDYWQLKSKPLEDKPKKREKTGINDWILDIETSEHTHSVAGWELGRLYPMIWYKEDYEIIAEPNPEINTTQIIYKKAGSNKETVVKNIKKGVFSTVQEYIDVIKPELLRINRILTYEGGGEVGDGNLHMLQNQSVQFKHHAEELKSALEKKPKVDAWVVAKAERAATDLSDITHYLDGRNDAKFEGGGYVRKTPATFKDKVRAISKRLKGTEVLPKYRSEYGKFYNAEESLQAARKIAGKMIQKEKKH